MLSEATAALGALKALTEMAKAVIDAKSESDRLAAVAKLQSALIDVQQNTLALQANAAELQDELIKLRRKNTELQAAKSDLDRYTQVQFQSTGAMVYELKEERVNPGELPHYLCPSCFVKSRKSILQKSGRHLICTECKSSFPTAPPRQLNRVRTRRTDMRI
jgi:hypothetical protein